MVTAPKKETSLAEKPFYYRLLAAVLLPPVILAFAAAVATLLLAVAAISPLICLFTPQHITWKE